MLVAALQRPLDPLEVEAQPAAGAAQADAPEFPGVRVHPIAIDPELLRDASRVD
ncbi:MAG: hypothetical protein ABSG93_01030 [Solirubrobacteraceae bacterium]